MSTENKCDTVQQQAGEQPIFAVLDDKVQFRSDGLEGNIRISVISAAAFRARPCSGESLPS